MKKKAVLEFYLFTDTDMPSNSLSVGNFKQELF
jgi:hypothetical protein